MTLPTSSTPPTSTALVSKYDMRINPVYQVDRQVIGSGKRVAATKRRICWKFGFSDAASLQKGLKGVHCRGSEHEITLIWSLTSAKRQVLMDGKEVYFAKGRRTETKLDISFHLEGHIIKIVAHATIPLLGAKPDFRQFDLLLDGCSFDKFPRIFELGIVDAVTKTIRQGKPRTQRTITQGASSHKGPGFSEPRPYFSEEQSALMLLPNHQEDVDIMNTPPGAYQRAFNEPSGAHHQMALTHQHASQGSYQRAFNEPSGTHHQMALTHQHANHFAMAPESRNNPAMDGTSFSDQVYV